MSNYAPELDNYYWQEGFTFANSLMGVVLSTFREVASAQVIVIPSSKDKLHLEIGRAHV